MSRPDKCRWCGCTEIIRDGFPTIDGGREVLFACRSVWYETALGWVRDPLQCGGQAGMLYKRIADAIDAAQQAIRLNLGLQDEDDEEVDWEHDGVAYVLESDLNRVVDILQGSYPEIPDDSASSPEIPEGSP